MFILTYLGTTILAVLAYVIFNTVQNWYRLRHIPGPFSAGFSKWWMLKHTWNGTMYIESAEQCFKHGRSIIKSTVKFA
jgi:hypothetical protein